MNILWLSMLSTYALLKNEFFPLHMLFSEVSSFSFLHMRFSKISFFPSPKLSSSCLEFGSPLSLWIGFDFPCGFHRWVICASSIGTWAVPLNSVGWECKRIGFARHVYIIFWKVNLYSVVIHLQSKMSWNLKLVFLFSFPGVLFRGNFSDAIEKLQKIQDLGLSSLAVKGKTYGTSDRIHSTKFSW